MRAILFGFPLLMETTDDDLETNREVIIQRVLRIGGIPLKSDRFRFNQTWETVVSGISGAEKLKFWLWLKNSNGFS